MTFSVGCDPEVFLKDAKGNVVSAIGKIGGTKQKPKVIDGLRSDWDRKAVFSLQEDNVTLEYNTPPAVNAAMWSNYHYLINDHIDKMLGQMGLKRHIVPSVVFPEKELEHPASWVFGCEPDYNAWELKANPRPHSPNPFLRSAGGHIHLGYEKPNKVASVELTRMLDAFIGVPLVAAEKPNDRMQLYGCAGAMRFKPYGLEYRTPSNFWTASANRVNWVFSNVWAAYNAYTKGLLKSYISKDIQEVINKADKTGAKTLMDKLGITPCPL